LGGVCSVLIQCLLYVNIMFRLKNLKNILWVTRVGKIAFIATYFLAWCLFFYIPYVFFIWDFPKFFLKVFPDYLLRDSYGLNENKIHDILFNVTNLSEIFFIGGYVISAIVKKNRGR